MCRALGKASGFCSLLLGIQVGINFLKIGDDTADNIGGVLFTQGSDFDSAGVIAALIVGTVLSAFFIWLARQVGQRLIGVDQRQAI